MLRDVVKRMPVVGPIMRSIHSKLFAHDVEPFAGSAQYWERRYVRGGDSGSGSYGKLAEFKADVLNQFVARHNVQNVIEFGCGDGNQLQLAHYSQYLGFDISPTAVARCRERFRNDPHKSFRLMGEYAGEQGDLSLSLDVIYHLVEDEVFEDYMRTLFTASHRYVIIYASDIEDPERKDGAHIRHRKFTNWVYDHLPQWRLIGHLPNRYPYQGGYRTGSFAEFSFYEKA